jgi:GNAT superfamily N-acetyltransferase
LYEAVATIDRAISAELGSADAARSAQASVVERANETTETKHWVLAVDDADPRVGLAWAFVGLPVLGDLEKAYAGVSVLPAQRRQGLGTVLLEWCETVVRDAGRRLVLVWSQYAGVEDHAPYVTGPTGAVAPASAGVAFALHRGFHLKQAERRSCLELPMDPGVFARLDADAQAHSGGYRFHTWDGVIPDEWLEPVGRLRQAFAQQAPAGGVEWDDDPWDRARVERMLDDYRQAGRCYLVTAAECVATGELVGLTEYTWPDDPGCPVAWQWMTLVLPDHRGHRLGLAMKLANTAGLTRRAPQLTLVLTENAHENAPMLAINVAMGFRPAGGSAMLAKELG